MRAAALVLTLAAPPAVAWEFVETDVCTVSHDGIDIALELVFAPATATYTISLTHPDQDWLESDTFRLQFDGPRPLVIGTDQHVKTQDNQTLSVSDTGFGNVLDGIQFNNVMTALNGDQTVALDTQNSTDAMVAFRACPSTPLS